MNSKEKPVLCTRCKAVSRYVEIGVCFRCDQLEEYGLTELAQRAINKEKK